MRKQVYCILVILICLNTFSLLIVSELQKDDLLKVVFFNIGQGDGVFIRTPEGYRIVIDGGPGYGLIAEKVSEVIPFWDKRIDLVLLTHSDHDHLNGLLGVLERYDVNAVVWNGIPGGDSQKDSNWKRMLEQEISEGCEVNLLKAGDRIVAGKVSMDILWPEIIPGEGKKVDPNAYSLVTRLCYHSNCFLFTGDIAFTQENDIIGKDIQSDILKVAHHGSKTATSNDFISAVNPDLAVIQVGNNNYGHPDEGVIGRLEKGGAKVLRNDHDGDIIIYSNGKEFWTE